MVTESDDAVTSDSPDERPDGWSAGQAGWSGNEVVKDAAGEPDGNSGWSGSEIVKDHPTPTEGDNGWSGEEVVADRRPPGDST